MNSDEGVFTKERLTIRRAQTRQQYVLFWSGECDFRNPAEILSPVLNSVLSELRDRRLVLDFRELSFMNSASVTPILAFVKSVCSKDIAVHLVYSATLSWQRTTASSMRALGRSLKLLSVELLGALENPR